MIYSVEHWVGDLWAVFAIVWVIAAFASKRSMQRQTSGSRILQSAIVVAGLLCVFNFGNVLTGGWLLTRVTPQTSGWVLTGAALTVAGMLIAFWARAILGSNWSARVTIKQNHELILRGPYAFVRHPIYTGLLVSVLGTALVYGFTRCFIGLLICGFGLWLKSQTEEQFMIQQFGEQYAQYRQRVRALVPFVL